MRNLFWIVMATGVIFSCKSTKTTTTTTTENKKAKMDTLTTESGLKYVITHKSNSGIKAQTGDKVFVHYTGKLTNDTVFDSSVKRGTPIDFPLGTGRVIKGWDEGIALLEKGDKATFIIPPAIGYGARAVGPIPANSTLVFDVELVDVVAKIHPKPYDTKGKDTITTASGLKYFLITEGNGPKATPGQMVKVHYTGYFLDGKIFDSSVERGEPFQFKLGAGQVIKGWDEGVALLKQGSKARFIIPYQLAYGERGYPGAIPPKTDLIFDVEYLQQQ